MIKVLFVCTGNICRSPMADAVFQHMVKEAGLEDKIQVDSAGTGGWHVGEKADPRTLQTLRKHDIPYDGRARKLQTDDLSQFDYVLAMDNSNMSNIQLMHQPSDTAEIKMFLHYTDTTTVEVPDPYYNDKFDLVYSLVREGCTALLEHVRAAHDI